MRRTPPGPPVAELIAVWVEGWCRSHRTPPATRIPQGFRIQVDAPLEVTRFVLRDGDPAGISVVSRGVSADRTWMKFPGDPRVTGRHFPEGWEVQPEEHLMTTRIVAVPRARVPAGYSLAVVDDEGVLEARVRATGSPVTLASARMALTGRHVVFDQVRTAPEHRRRGLALAMMSALSREAVTRGTRHGVLLSSPQGRALYASLGWAIVSPMTAARFAAPPAR